MQEEWCSIQGFPDYAVSNYGYVQNQLTGRMMTRSPVQYGMLTVAMVREGQQYRRAVSGLVADAFLPPPIRDDFNTPIHLDGDRKNCRSDNLAWRPRWFAINYHLERRSNLFGQRIRDFRLMETLEVFDDITVAAKKYGLLGREIHNSLVNGTRTFPHGYTFEFLS